MSKSTMRLMNNSKNKLNSKIIFIFNLFSNAHIRIVKVRKHNYMMVVSDTKNSKNSKSM